MYAYIQLGRSRTLKDILEGWIVEGSDYQPGVIEILKSARTSEVGGSVDGWGVGWLLL